MRRCVATARGENREGRVRKRVGQEGATNRYVITGFVFLSPNKTCSSLHHVVLNRIEIFAGSNNFICWPNTFLSWIGKKEIRWWKLRCMTFAHSENANNSDNKRKVFRSLNHLFEFATYNVIHKFYVIKISKIKLEFKLNFYLANCIYINSKTAIVFFLQLQ